MSVKPGLTGSIGMGKSTTAAMFRELGCAVWDADSAVHRLYEKNGEAVGPIAAEFPLAVVDGAVSRDVLRQMVAEDPSVIPVLNDIVHPLVVQNRAIFSAETKTEILVFDIPLLFETGADQTMDVVACVSIPPQEQERRVLARGMSKDQFDAIIANQMPNPDKCERSDFVIVTDTLAHAQKQVEDIVHTLKARNHA